MQFPNIDPIALQLGPIAIHWYGLMYVIGFFGGLWLGKYRARTQPWRGWTTQQVDDLLFYIVAGIIVGGRLGSTFFYNFDSFLADPTSIIRVWEGGMSFHGGFIGVIVAVIIFAKRKGKSWFEVGDFVAPLVPLGIAAGRLGNFINGELWGNPTDMPWGMIFPGAGDEPRHPSQIYQMLGEGLTLMITLWWFSSKPRPRMAVSGFFFIGYGILRTAAEFFRVPDAHIGYLAMEWLTMGMILSLPMIIIGAVLMTLAYKQGKLDVYDESGKKA